jgi:bifunctional non-homologous end joining protein LigD
MPGGNSFVIQQHHATALHWDFRLERDGVLVSWAVPKGVPTDPSVNRLAVHVDDHALDYAKYAGPIAAGQYGAGSVSIWDSGTYVTEKWTDREVKVVLSGQRVQGRFVLFATGGKNWMMHRMDGPPRPDWQRLPVHLEPMHATPAPLPRGQGWAYELAWPGRRTLARIEGGRVQLTPPARIPQLAELGERLGTTQVMLDGVLARFGPSENVYLIFDLLHVDGRSLLEAPYRERRERLAELELAGPAWQVPPIFEGHGHEALQASADQQLGGVIAKRLASTYRPGETTKDWLAISPSA